LTSARISSYADPGMPPRPARPASAFGGSAPKANGGGLAAVNTDRQ
jgi:hypothetical protein